MYVILSSILQGKLSKGGTIRSAAVGPLTGVVVVDFSNVLAGPFAAALLADLGAEVIKIDNMKLPDSARGLGNAPTRGMAGLFMHSGMRSKLLLNPAVARFPIESDCCVGRAWEAINRPRSAYNRRYGGGEKAGREG